MMVCDVQKWPHKIGQGNKLEVLLKTGRCNTVERDNEEEEEETFARV